MNLAYFGEMLKHANFALRVLSAELPKQMLSLV